MPELPPLDARLETFVVQDPDRLASRVQPEHTVYATELLGLPLPQLLKRAENFLADVTTEEGELNLLQNRGPEVSKTVIDNGLILHMILNTLGNQLKRLIASTHDELVIGQLLELCSRYCEKLGLLFKKDEFYTRREQGNLIELPPEAAPLLAVMTMRTQVWRRTLDQRNSKASGKFANNRIDALFLALRSAEKGAVSVENLGSVFDRPDDVHRKEVRDEVTRVSGADFGGRYYGSIWRELRAYAELYSIADQAIKQKQDLAQITRRQIILVSDQRDGRSPVFFGHEKSGPHIDLNDGGVIAQIMAARERILEAIARKEAFIQRMNARRHRYGGWDCKP